MKRGDRVVATSWEDALATIADGLATSGAQGDEIQAVAGHLADTESLVALKDLPSRSTSGPAHGLGVDVRSKYLFNCTIPGVKRADALFPHLSLTSWSHRPFITNDSAAPYFSHTTSPVTQH